MKKKKRCTRVGAGALAAVLAVTFSSGTGTAGGENRIPDSDEFRS